MRVFVVCLLALLGLAFAQNNNPIFPFTNNCTNCEIASWAFPSTTSIIIATNDGKVWSSQNSGDNWNQIINWNKISQIVQQNSTIYFFPWTGTNFYYSTNGGATIVNATLPAPMGQIQTYSFQPHPTQAGWAIVGSCTGNPIPTSCTMYYTKNYGASWTASYQGQLSTPVVNILWGNSTATPDLVWVIKKDGNLVYTSNYGGSEFVLFQNVAGMVQTQNYFFVATSEGTTVWLYASSSRADTVHTNRGKYNLAQFPTGNNIPNGYTFLDDTTRAEYLGVHVQYPSGTQPQWGTIYNSQFDGAYYQITLDHIYYNNQGAYDFHRVRSLPGIYIANHVLNWEQLNEPAIKDTIITFDNGAEWRPLDAPNFDMNGNLFPCPAPSNWGCSLHLHADTSTYDPSSGVSFPGWRTHSSAVGLIVANGNVGHQLSYALSEVSTFLSRDGGLTWTQIVQQPTVFEFGNHGGYLVLAPAMVLTNYIWYSFDFGNTTQQLVFTDVSQSIYITSIFTEPFGTGQQFVINGWAGSNLTTAQWFIYTVDLSVYSLRVCDPSNDFEPFIPSNGNEQTCFMGATTTFTRRKALSPCYDNNPLSDTIVAQTPCPCAIQDYECDWNYNLVFNGTAQNPSFNCTLNYPATWCQSGDSHYWEQTGYTLVPDTLCSPTAPGAVNLVATLKECPKKKHPAEVAAAVIVTLLVVGGVVAVGLLYWKNDRFRNWVLSFRRGADQYTTIQNS